MRKLCTTIQKYSLFVLTVHSTVFPRRSWKILLIIFPWKCRIHSFAAVHRLKFHFFFFKHFFFFFLQIAHDERRTKIFINGKGNERILIKKFPSLAPFIHLTIKYNKLLRSSNVIFYNKIQPPYFLTILAISR